jgi:hypothetical protein
MPNKIDLRKIYKSLYSAKSEPSIVEVPALAAFTIEGSGDPNSSQRFQECIGALYAVSFTLKFALKKERGLDWGVLGFEGEWWCDNMTEFSMERKAEWKWRLFMVQPDFITEADALTAIETAAKKKDPSPALKELCFERAAAHEAAQILHLGPYDDEPPTIARLHEFIKGSSLSMEGRHREIYLNDARRTAPAKLRTIIRQGVVRR